MAALYLVTDPEVTLVLATKPGFRLEASVVLIGRAPHASAKVAITGLIKNPPPPLAFRLNASVQGEPVHLFNLLFKRNDGIQKTAVDVDTQGFQRDTGVSES
jgi:hypothetical protein